MTKRAVSRRVRLTAVSLTAATSLIGLVGCGGEEAQSPDMGNAVPANSPAADDPAGEIIPLPSGEDAITDMERASSDVLALRSETALSIGTVDQFRNDEAAHLTVDAQCGDLTATDGTFVLPCPDGVYLIDAAEPDLDTLHSTERPVTVAALTSTGELIVGDDQEPEVTVYRDGEDPETFTVAHGTDQMIAVPGSDRLDAVIRSYNPNTTIQDLHWAENEQGGTLRAGVGIGQITGGVNGLVLASDTRGDQLLVYVADEVIRLHQSFPVGSSPWGVAWDDGNHLAWVASTADNQLVGYDISEGEPSERARVNTIADARNIVVLDDSSLVAVSASGDGLQVIDSPLQ